ncbi:hypothetical protein P280DRAFT_465892 [Massarina eburnea CBS 473.64]|uniref:BTB domain-containing protein n=1 Tax=Massarina eburnea CBS 473.64 TaxID=1395130 RepID=A0A6A6SAL0_9PLEO|nr:hypothetical protein P280DRAFT_465892 [Massarina eburnea CBS 473.64]
MSFYLPQALISHDSHYFREEIAKATNGSSGDAFTSRFPTEASPIKETSTTLAPTSYTTPYSTTPIIRLHNVDPVVFGLYLRFLYQGSYSAKVFTSTFGSGSTNSKSTTNGAPNPVTQGDMIPVHFRAWVFGSSIRSTNFQNHAIDHIYRSSGLKFSLTPSIVAWVWSHTCRSPSGSASFSPACESPLRSLALDILVNHWSTSTNHVARFPSLIPMWNHVFNTYPDLRHDFIFGLQGRRIMPNQAYWIREGDCLEDQKVSKGQNGAGEQGNGTVKRADSNGSQGGKVHADPNPKTVPIKKEVVSRKVNMALFGRPQFQTPAAVGLPMQQSCPIPLRAQSAVSSTSHKVDKGLMTDPELSPTSKKIKGIPPTTDSPAILAPSPTFYPPKVPMKRSASPSYEGLGKEAKVLKVEHVQEDAKP